MLAQVVKAAGAGERRGRTGGHSQAVADVEVSRERRRSREPGFRGEAWASSGQPCAASPARRRNSHVLAPHSAKFSARALVSSARQPTVSAAYLAGAVPFAGRHNGHERPAMLRAAAQGLPAAGRRSRTRYQDPQQAMAAMNAGRVGGGDEPYQHRALDYADVLLPIAPFTETSGTFVNTEGRVQSFQWRGQAARRDATGMEGVARAGQPARLRASITHECEAVRREVLGAARHRRQSRQRFDGRRVFRCRQVPTGALERIAEVPIYHADAIVRRAPSLQATRDAPPPAACMQPSLARDAWACATATGSGAPGAARPCCAVAIDDKLPADCVRVPAARADTTGLGAMFGAMTAERVPVAEGGG